jgi:hypothetical protein
LGKKFVVFFTFLKNTVMALVFVACFFSKPLCKETTDLKEGQNPASEAHSHAVPGAQKIEYLQNLYSVVF